MIPFTRRIDPELTRFLLSTCRGVAVVAAVFSVAMATLLIANYAQLATLKPTDNPALTALREQYRSAPENDELAARIRALDLAGRRAYFTRQWQTRTAGYLLIPGVVLLIACLRAVTALTKSLPQPRPQGAETALWFPPTARVGLTVVGCLFLAGAVVSAVLGDSLIKREFSGVAGKASRDAAATPGRTAAAAGTSGAAPSSPEYRDNWPQFRGPDGLGIASPQDPPVDWDGKTGKNVAWKADVPLPGRSSPVVWGDRVFLSGATSSVREVFCWDAATGKLLWRTPIPRPKGPPRRRPMWARPRASLPPQWR